MNERLVPELESHTESIVSILIGQETCRLHASYFLCTSTSSATIQNVQSKAYSGRVLVCSCTIFRRLPATNLGRVASQFEEKEEPQ